MNREPTGASGVPNREQAWSFQAGIVYEINDFLSVYGSYSESFNPNFGIDIDGQPLEAEIGEGFDVGVKSMLLDDRLFISASYFYITKIQYRHRGHQRSRLSLRCLGGRWRAAQPGL